MKIPILKRFKFKFKDKAINITTCIISIMIGIVNWVSFGINDNILYEVLPLTFTINLGFLLWIWNYHLDIKIIFKKLC